MEKKQTIDFIGNGSCFNTEFGNNAAYYKEEQGKRLLLIDCGESIFERVRKLKLLEKAEEISVLITHLHTDHVGSLSSLIYFCQYVKGIKPTIIYPEKEKLEQLLTITENESNTFQLVAQSEYEKFPIEAIRQQHTKVAGAYGYILEIGGKRIYYSGDTKTISPKVIQEFREGKLDEFYQDVSRYDTPAHISIEELKRIFNQSERSQITCMHFDDEITRQMAECLGFNVARVKGLRELER